MVLLLSIFCFNAFLVAPVNWLLHENLVALLTGCVVVTNRSICRLFVITILLLCIVQSSILPVPFIICSCPVGCCLFVYRNLVPSVYSICELFASQGKCLNTRSDPVMHTTCVSALMIPHFPFVFICILASGRWLSLVSEQLQFVSFFG